MKRINSTEIARLAGVSRSTVSRVINNYPNVPEATREHVMRIIRENHYYPQLSGKMLMGKRSRTIGLFWVTDCSSIANDSLSSMYFMHIIDEATFRNYMILSCVVRNLTDPDNVQFVRRTFNEGRIDAGIFVGMDLNTPIITELLDTGEVVGTFDYTDPAHHPTLISANFEKNIGEKVADCLYELGHRKVAVIHGDMNKLTCIDRAEGTIAALEKRGITVPDKWTGYAGITQNGGYECAKAMLSATLDDLPTAICASNDCVAFCVYQALNELGIGIGTDISVIGADGHPHNGFAYPTLTSVEFDFREMFSTLVDRLIDLLETGETEQNEYYMEGTLVIRDSVRDLRP